MMRQDNMNKMEMNWPCSKKDDSISKKKIIWTPAGKWKRGRPKMEEDYKRRTRTITSELAPPCKEPADKAKWRTLVYGP